MWRTKFIYPLFGLIILFYLLFYLRRDTTIYIQSSCECEFSIWGQSENTEIPRDTVVLSSLYPSKVYTVQNEFPLELNFLNMDRSTGGYLIKVLDKSIFRYRVLNLSIEESSVVINEEKKIFRPIFQ